MDFPQILDHHAVVILDNLSHIPKAISDDLCGAVTGTGCTKRQLYTDEDDVIFSYRRTAMLTSLKVPTTQSDLLDRAILVKFKRILDEDRRDETSLKADFHRDASQSAGSYADHPVESDGAH